MLQHERCSVHLETRVSIVVSSIVLTLGDEFRMSPAFRTDFIILKSTALLSPLTIALALAFIDFQCRRVNSYQVSGLEVQCFKRCLDSSLDHEKDLLGRGYDS